MEEKQEIILPVDESTMITLSLVLLIVKTSDELLKLYLKYKNKGGNNVTSI